MAMIARNFELELDDTHGPVRERLSFTMVPEGLRVLVRERASTDAVSAGVSEAGLASVGGPRAPAPGT